MEIVLVHHRANVGAPEKTSFGREKGLSVIMGDTSIICLTIAIFLEDNKIIMCQQEFMFSTHDL